MKKMIRGHSHTPAISKGTYIVGTMTKSLGYNTSQGGTWAAGQPVRSGDMAAMYAMHYGAQIEHPIPRRREAVEHTRRKLGL